MTHNPIHSDDGVADQLSMIRALCAALDIPVGDALDELRYLLEERREFAAIAHPDWRVRNLDKALERLRQIYAGDEEEAGLRFAAIRELTRRGGRRADDPAARGQWRGHQLARAQNQCEYCHRALSGANSVVDHRIPLGRGGNDNETNWQLICALCNAGKSDLLTDRVLSPWRSGRLFRELVLVGKVSLTPVERFDILSRSHFTCRRSSVGEACSDLRIIFRRPPADGGQAVPENLVVVCSNHIKTGEIECL